MRNNKNLFKKVAKTTLAVGVALTISLGAAQAAQALSTLSGVEINGSSNSGYEVVLNADQNIEFKKYIDSKNRVILDLKDTSVSKNLNTLYNQTTGIDHVMFKPVSKDHVKVYIEGKNVAYSDIYINTGLFPKNASKPSTGEEVVQLNKPINSYAPVVSVEEESESQVSTKEFYTEMLSSFAPSKLFDKANLGWLVSFGMLIIFLSGVLKGVREKHKVNIKISEDLKQKEIDLYSQLNKKRGLIDTGLGSNKKADISAGSVSKAAYGIKAYENSQRNPLKNTSRMSGVKSGYNASSVNPYNNKQALNNPGLNKKRASVGLKTQASAVAQQHQKDIEIDSARFLESMAKIYEKSGRVDLANGLQNNILRAKTRR